MPRLLDTLLLATAIVMFSCSHAGAIDCELDMTVNECIRKSLGARDSMDTQAAAAVRQRVNTFVTGLGIEDSTARSAVTDFLARFAVSTETGNIGDDAVGLAFAISKPLDLGIGDYRVQATLHDPSVYAPLLEAIPEAQREARGDSLKDGLDDLSDVLVVATWGFNGELWNNFKVGRQIETKSEENRTLGRIFDQMFRKVLVTPAMKEKVQAEDGLQSYLRSNGFPGGIPNTKLADIKIQSEQKFEETLARIQGVVRAFSALDAEFLRQEAANDIDTFAAMVSNQPQLTVSGSARIRDEAVGPEQYSGKLLLEVPIATSFNDFMSFREQKCGGSGKAVDARCWSQFVDEEDARNGASSSHRVSLSVAYERSDQYDVSIGEGTELLEVMLDEEDQLSVVAGFGTAVQMFGNATDTRFDVALEYVDTFGSDATQDRFVGSATLTRKIAGGAALVVGLNYSNKDEYRAESDKELGANVGLVYRFTTNN